MSMKKLAITGALIAGLFPSMAEAQRGRSAAPATHQRGPAPAMNGRAVPRQSSQAPVTTQQDWQRFRGGVNIRDRSFSVGISYSSGMPFYGGIPGRIFNNMWFPLGCFPQRLSRFEIEAWQYYNISRPYPTIGQMQTYAITRP